MTERPDHADQEGFGEAELGEAQAETTPPDPDLAEDPTSEEELTDVPALAPAPIDETEEEAEEEAAAEAGAIGGSVSSKPGAEGISEADRPLAEAGEGEAEGFEESERELIESASHGDSSGNPLGDRFAAEEARAEGLSIDAEADHVEVSDDDIDDGEDD